MAKFKSTQSFTKANINKVPQSKAIVYKIKTTIGKNIYTGIAGRNRCQDRLLEHRTLKKENIPGGTKFQYLQVKNKNIAEKIEKRIIRTEQPKFNKVNK